MDELREEDEEDEVEAIEMEVFSTCCSNNILKSDKKISNFHKLGKQVTILFLYSKNKVIKSVNYNTTKLTSTITTY